MLRIAALLGLMAVALGAFGAHALDGRLNAEAMGWWTTAGQYLLPHAIAVAAGSGRPGWRWSCWGWALGALIFAATLYAMALGAPRWLGAVTPVGGVLMLAGWAALLMTRDTARA